MAAAAIEAITRLPDAIGLLSLRDLAWPMAKLVEDGVRLNLMSLEALGAAEYLQGDLCLAISDENPPLLTAAKARRTPVRLLS